MEDDWDLEEIIEKQNKIKKRREKMQVPSSIKITKNAMLKAFSVGKLVKEKAGRSFEWYSLLIGNPEDPDYIVRDFILAPNQNVSSGSVTVAPDQVIQAERELNKRNSKNGTNYKIFGWMHSHAGFSPFHSGTDVNNFKKILNRYAEHTERSIHIPFDLIKKPTQSIEDETIQIEGESIEDCILKYRVTEETRSVLEKYGINPDENSLALNLLNDLIAAAEFEVLEPKKYGFVYSIVVNDACDTPYAEIATIERNILTQVKNTPPTIKTNVEVVEVDDDIKLNLKALGKEIESKINYSRGFWHREKPKVNRRRRHKKLPRIRKEAKVVKKSEEPIAIETPEQPIEKSGTEKLHELAKIFFAYEFVKYAKSTYSTYGYWAEQIINEAPEGAQSLSDTIADIGSPQNLKVPLLRVTWINPNLVFDENFIDYIKSGSYDEETITFMHNFTLSRDDSTKRSRVIEEYVTNLLSKSEETDTEKIDPKAKEKLYDSKEEEE